MSDFSFLGQSSEFWIIAVIAVFIMGVSKGGFGSGLNAASTPLLALASNPVTAAAVMLPLLNVMDAVGIRAYWGKWNLRTVLWLVPPMVLGVVAGIVLFNTVDADWLRILIGLVCLWVVLDRWGIWKRLGANLLASSGSARANGPSSWILGTLLGITSTIAHAGGPAGSSFLLRFNFDKTTFQATTILTFTTVNIIKFPFYVASGAFVMETMKISAVLFPLAAGSMVLGVVLHKLVPQRPFFIMMEVLLFLLGWKLLWDGTTGLMS